MKKTLAKLLAILLIVVMITIPTIALADAGATKALTIPWVEIVAVAEAAGIIIAWFALSYFKTSTKFRSFVAQLIADAEVKYAKVEKAGKLKMNWVIEQIYAFIPAPFKLIFTEERLRTFVQEVFDKIAVYATMQCDRAVEALQAKYNSAKADKSRPDKE